MNIVRYIKETVKQITVGSKQMRIDSEKNLEKLTTHIQEFDEEFLSAKSEIEEKRKSIQKIMR